MSGPDPAGVLPAPPAGFRSGVVALVGRANVGKSTLMNRLVGAKLAIVSEVPQTTRVPIRGVLHRSGFQIVFIDTPGIHRPRHLMNEEMVRTATRLLHDVDRVAILVDASEGFGPGDRFVFDRARESGAKCLLILNKIDLMPKDRLLPLMDEAARSGLFEEIVPVSALGGENCDRLEEVLARTLPEGPPLFPPDMMTDLPRRMAVAELIREPIFRKTRQEVPHSAAVLVETMDTTDSGLERVRATIYVDKESQKAILIGERGRMIKDIGTEARHALEDFLGHRVHLELWVKVREGWRDDAGILRLLGLVTA
ncbi:MAG: GTPase Era [Candidatus Polarisedimenticolia bacterium]